MIEQKTWKEFRDTGMMWCANRILHTFGWAIVAEVDENDEILKAFPARVKFRGFGQESEERGFRKVSNYMKENIDQLKEEADQ